jgi:transmembrane sensor
MRKLGGARQHLDPEFDATRVEAGVAVLSQRIQRAQRRRRAGAALVGVAAALLVVGAWRLREQRHGAELARAPAQVETQDGSRATRLSPETEIALLRDTRDDVALELVRGRGHFKVTPKPRRHYRVRAGQVEVQVLGTAFEVERLGPRTRVRVEHGVVRVRWNEGESILRAGEQGLFPREPAPASSLGPTAARAPEPAPTLPEPELEPDMAEVEPALATAADLHEGKARHERWRVLARAGKHHEAFGSLGRRSVDDLAGLLLAADAARLSGHPREAAHHLERLIERYPHSGPAHLAAFTLGRLALYELKQPALAARSFARAYALNAEGPLAQDALAREAEAYHRAGDAGRARNAAERYLQRYPNGARAAEVARYLGAAP